MRKIIDLTGALLGCLVVLNAVSLFVDARWHASIGAGAGYLLAERQDILLKLLEAYGLHRVRRWMWDLANILFHLLVAGFCVGLGAWSNWLDGVFF